MSRKACHKENHARTLLGGPSKCIGKHRQSEACQDFAKKAFKMFRKACHKANRARSLLEARFFASSYQNFMPLSLRFWPSDFQKGR